MAGPTIPNQGFLSIGLNPLAYMGVRPTSPAQYLIESRDPLTTDRNYILGTWWFNNNSPYNLWRLVNLNAGVALWILVNASPGALLSLTSNSGGAVFPLAGNINVVGDGITITGVGNPATHTITFSLLGSGVVETLTGNSGGAVGPSAGNINVVGDGTTIDVVGNPATHTLTISAVGSGVMETLTGNSGGAVSPLAGNINVVGDGTTVNVVGNPATHTLTISAVGTGTVEGLHTQDGNTVTPTAGIINISGGNNLTTTGTIGPNTVTISLSGITQHDVQVGGASNSLTQIVNGTTGQVLTAQTGADPIWSTGFPTASTPYTPVLAFGGASTGITYSGQGGSYTQIGNIVFWGVFVTLTSKGVSVGQASVTMPPILPVGPTRPPTDFSLDGDNFSLPAGAILVWGNYNTGSNPPTANFESSDGSALTFLNDTHFTNLSDFQMFGFYFTA